MLAFARSVTYDLTVERNRLKMNLKTQKSSAIGISAVLLATLAISNAAPAQSTVTGTRQTPAQTGRAASPQTSPVMRPASGPLLFEDAVADDLRLTANQRKMPDSDSIWKSLTPSQRKRVAQIVMHLVGNQLLLDPEIKDRLSLTPEQVDSLQKAQMESLKKFRALMDPATGAISDANRPKLEEIGRETELAIAAVPTAEQSAKLKTLLGAPFDRTKVRSVSFGHSLDGKLGDPGPNVHRPEAPKVTLNSLAPNFLATTIDGKQVALTDYRGKVVVLDFWATWCGPCEQSMPGMEKLRSKIKDPKVVFLWLCVNDDQANYRQFVKSNPQYGFSFLFDPAGVQNSDHPTGISAEYSVTGIPATFVISPFGHVVFRGEGTDGQGPDPKLVKALSALGVKQK